MGIYLGTRDEEAGAAFVEFALLVPVFMILVLGIITAAQAYNIKQSVTSGAREGSRYGATLPLNVDSTCGNASGSPTVASQNWLTCVSTLVTQSATGDLSQSQTGRYVCVSFVQGSSTIPTASRYVSTSDASPTYSTSDCYTLNGLSNDTLTVPHVQIVTKRTAPLQWLVGSTNLTLRSSSVTLYEGATS